MEGASTTAAGSESPASTGETQGQPKSIGTQIPEGYRDSSARSEAKQQNRSNSFQEAEVTEKADPYTAEWAELSKKKARVKVDGQDMELTVEQLAKDYGLKASSMKRFEEAAKVRKEAESFVENLLADPKSVLSHPKFQEKGFNLRQFAETVLRDEIEKEMLSPEELQQRQKDKEFDDLKGWKQQQEDAKQQESYQRSKVAAEQKYSTKFQEALDGAKLPKNPFTLKRMAEYQRQALRTGYDLTSQELGDLVRDEATTDLKALTSHLDDETLINILGEEVVKKIREYDLKRVQGGGRPAQQVQSQVLNQRRQPAEKKMTVQAWQEMRRKQYGV